MVLLKFYLKKMHIYCFIFITGNDMLVFQLKLDRYEGMSHDFQTFLFHNSAGSNIAVCKTSDFLKASYLTHIRLALDMLHCID